MNRLIKETDQVIKLNLRQLVIFEVLFRLVAGTFYIRLVNQLLRFSLRMAGYSYLTMSNMGAFLLRPATIVCALLAAVLGGVIYYIVIQLVLQMGLNANDLKLFSALVVALFLGVPYWKGQLSAKHVKTNKGGKDNA